MALMQWLSVQISGLRLLPVQNGKIQAVPELKKVKHVFMLAEWETPEMHDTAFDMTYSWDLYKLIRAVYKGEKTPDLIDSIFVKEDTTFNSDAYRMHFTTNHDENSWNGTEYELFDGNAQTFTVLDYLLPGMPLIYSGQEAGLSKRMRFFDKDTIDWGTYRLAPFYTTLNKLKHENKALQNGAAGGPLVKLKAGGNSRIYAFSREAEGSKVVALFNLSPEPANAVLAENGLSGDYEDVFNPGIVKLDDSFSIQLKPWEYRVFVKK